jgi:multisubunit Na+/H+ antiporter MnhG subunit
MGWDIRLPIGGLFTVLGVLLAGYGLFGSKDIYERSLGININLVWGIPMLVFGVAMIMLARRANRSTH